MFFLHSALKAAKGDAEAESLAKAKVEISLEYASLAEHDAIMYPRAGSNTVVPPVPIDPESLNDGSMEYGKRGGERFDKETMRTVEYLVARQVTDDGGVPQNIAYVKKKPG